MKLFPHFTPSIPCRSTLVAVLPRRRALRHRRRASSGHPAPPPTHLSEITPLADGTYKFIQEPDGDISKAQANIVELTEAPNSDSEESKSTDPIDTNTGKARCIILLFLNYTIQYCLLVHLSYWS